MLVSYTYDERCNDRFSLPGESTRKGVYVLPRRFRWLGTYESNCNDRCIV